MKDLQLFVIIIIDDFLSFELILVIYKINEIVFYFVESNA